MSTLVSLNDFRSALFETIGKGAPVDFSAAARDLFQLQCDRIPMLAKLAARRGLAAEIADWRDIPAVPTSAFKELELTSIPVDERRRVFHSSGTTETRPSRHFHGADSLAVYEASLRRWFDPHLNPADERLRMLSLTPPPESVPHSSLAHMMGTVSDRFADARFFGEAGVDGWALQTEALLAGLRESERGGEPVALLGTAFSFVHLLDALAARDERLELPAGSRVMETGGYKGRSRVVPKDELHEMISDRLGLGRKWIVCEYGMSELSSQAYDTVAGAGGERVFRFPPWARAKVVSPETGRETAVGETGLLQIVDLANIYSVMAIQTDDLAVRRADGFELIGRAVAAEPRGCSLMPEVTA